MMGPHKSYQKPLESCHNVIIRGKTANGPKRGRGEDTMISLYHRRKAQAQTGDRDYEELLATGTINLVVGHGPSKKEFSIHRQLFHSKSPLLHKWIISYPNNYTLYLPSSDSNLFSVIINWAYSGNINTLRQLSYLPPPPQPRSKISRETEIDPSTLPLTPDQITKIANAVTIISVQPLGRKFKTKILVHTTEESQIYEQKIPNSDHTTLDILRVKLQGSQFPTYTSFLNALLQIQINCERAFGKNSLLTIRAEKMTAKIQEKMISIFPHLREAAGNQLGTFHQGKGKEPEIDIHKHSTNLLTLYFLAEKYEIANLSSLCLKTLSSHQRLTRSWSREQDIKYVYRMTRGSRKGKEEPMRMYMRDCVLFGWMFYQMGREGGECEDVAGMIGRVPELLGEVVARLTGMNGVTMVDPRGVRWGGEYDEGEEGFRLKAREEGAFEEVGYEGDEFGDNKHGCSGYEKGEGYEETILGFGRFEDVEVDARTYEGFEHEQGRNAVVKYKRAQSGGGGYENQDYEGFQFEGEKTAVVSYKRSQDEATRYEDEELVAEMGNANVGRYQNFRQKPARHQQTQPGPSRNRADRYQDNEYEDEEFCQEHGGHNIVKYQPFQPGPSRMRAAQYSTESNDEFEPNKPQNSIVRKTQAPQEPDRYQHLHQPAPVRVGTFQLEDNISNQPDYEEGRTSSVAYRGLRQESARYDELQPGPSRQENRGCQSPLCDDAHYEDYSVNHEESQPGPSRQVAGRYEDNNYDEVEPEESGYNLSKHKKPGQEPKRYQTQAGPSRHQTRSYQSPTCDDVNYEDNAIDYEVCQPGPSKQPSRRYQNPTSSSSNCEAPNLNYEESHPEPTRKSKSNYTSNPSPPYQAQAQAQPYAKLSHANLRHHNQVYPNTTVNWQDYLQTIDHEEDGEVGEIDDKVQYSHRPQKRKR